MHLHEFLTEVHAIVQPKTYLEIGVQNGTSLNLAKAATLAIGVDPYPLWSQCCNQVIFPQPSDVFFDRGGLETFGLKPIDFGFIDGLHHAEQAMRDFLNLQAGLSPSGIIVIDDVLPRNQGEANRVQCPGDWTGDVWKMADRLFMGDGNGGSSGVQCMYVDTAPTGVLVVTGAVDDGLWQLHQDLPELSQLWQADAAVPDYILNRDSAVDPHTALEELRSIPWN